MKGSLLKFAGWVIVALAGFCLVSTLIHEAISRLVDPLALYAGMRSEKLALLNGAPGDYAVAAFGSSHVHDAFDPRAFDRTFHDEENGSKSINLAVSGGSQTEQRALAIAFLKHLERLGIQRCVVILEFNAGLNLQPEHLMHPRTINLYDWSTVSFTSEFTDPHAGLKKYFGRMGFGLLGGGLHYLSVGMLSSFIFPARLDPKLLDDQTGDDRRGLHVLLSDSSDSDVKKAFANRPAHPPIEKLPIEPGNLRLLSDLAHATHIPEIQFVYVVTPLLEDLAVSPEFPASVQGPFGEVPIINLAAAGSPLFQENLWHDSGHLNEDGAALFSSLLGEKLSQFLALKKR